MNLRIERLGLAARLIGCNNVYPAILLSCHTRLARLRTTLRRSSRASLASSPNSAERESSRKILAVICLTCAFCVSCELLAAAIKRPRTRAAMVPIRPVPSRTTSCASPPRLCSGIALLRSAPSRMPLMMHASAMNESVNQANNRIASDCLMPARYQQASCVLVAAEPLAAGAISAAPAAV